jgi:hypothetical protein
MYHVGYLPEISAEFMENKTLNENTTSKFQ